MTERRYSCADLQQSQSKANVGFDEQTEAMEIGRMNKPFSPDVISFIQKVRRTPL